MFPIKVQILDRCEHCDGEAYVFDRVKTDSNGQEYDHYKPCAHCRGSGVSTRWVSLQEFADLLDRAVSMEPDWQMLSREQPISQYEDSCQSAGI